MVEVEAPHAGASKQVDGGDACSDLPEPSGLRVGMLSLGDPSDVRTWSGTPFYMARALEQRFGQIERIGPLASPALKPFRLYGRLLKLIGGKDFSAVHDRRVAAGFAADAARKLRERPLDAVVAPAGSPFVMGVPPEMALVYSSDATFRRVIGYHPHYRALAKSTLRDADDLERAAISRADLLLYPTDWAARSAIDDYGADPEKVHVIPYGANFAAPPPRPAARGLLAPGRCSLLFVGVNWREKGASIAVDALRSLRGSGIDAELTICGCTPPEPVVENGLRVIPFLNKHDPAERARLEALYRDADFLVLPTRADCYGIAFCEASAYGLPSIATSTGGVPGVVSDGENGYLLPASAGGADYAALIAEIASDADRYGELRRTSRQRFEQHLNWDVWGVAASQLIGQAVARKAAKTP